MGQILLSVRILACITVAGVTLYAHINKRNELTELRLVLPGVEKEVKCLKRENMLFQYEIDRFESPIRLLELAQKPEYGHLKFPYLRDVIILQEGEEE